MKDITILFLAKYAPVREYDESDIEYEKEYHEYHKELFIELQKHCKVIPSNQYDDIIKYKQEIDFIFSVYNNGKFHGAETLSSTLGEYCGIPYIGALPTIRALAEDKHIAKMLAKHAKVPTPEWTVVSTFEELENINIDFEGPYFIKPRFGANSDFISLNSRQKTLVGMKEQVRFLIKKQVDVIIEECIDGVYYTVPVWNNGGNIEVFPAVRQHSSNIANIVTHKQKTYMADGLSRSIISDSKLQNKLNTYVKRIYTLLEPLDFARFDFLVNENNNDIYFIEINICCSLSKRSTFALSANSVGLTYSQLIKKLLEHSLKRAKIL